MLMKAQTDTAHTRRPANDCNFQFLVPPLPSSLYIKAGHPLAFSFPFSLTSMPRSLEYFSESPAFQFYSFIKATQQPLRLLHIKEAAIVFFLFTSSIILSTSGSLKREAPVKNYNHSSWAEDLKVKSLLEKNIRKHKYFFFPLSFL